MTATVLDVIWCFDCAVRRDLIASTALSPARSCRFYAYLLQQPGTHLYPAASTPQSVTAVRRCATYQNAPHATARPTPSSVRLGSTDGPPSTSMRNSKGSKLGDAGTTSPSR